MSIRRQGDLFVCDTNHENDLRWCNHLQAFFGEGKDVDYISADMFLDVPVAPKDDIFATVFIGKPEYGEAAKITFHIYPEFGRTRYVPLGIWNPGEGVKVIRGVILDYIRSELDPRDKISGSDTIHTKCPSPTHGPLERKRMRLLSASDSTRFVCLWNIVTERACTPCMELSKPDDARIDPNDLQNAPWRRP